MVVIIRKIISSLFSKKLLYINIQTLPTPHEGDRNEVRESLKKDNGQRNVLTEKVERDCLVLGLHRTLSNIHTIKSIKRTASPLGWQFVFLLVR